MERKKGKERPPSTKAVQKAPANQGREEIAMTGWKS